MNVKADITSQAWSTHMQLYTHSCPWIFPVLQVEVQCTFVYLYIFLNIQIYLNTIHTNTCTGITSEEGMKAYANGSSKEEKE